MGAVELTPREGAHGTRGQETFVKCYDRGVMIRYAGDVLQFSPCLNFEEVHITQTFDTLAEVLKTIK